MMAARPRVVTGLALAACSYALFATQDATVKALVTVYAVPQILFFRSVVIMIIAFVCGGGPRAQSERLAQILDARNIRGVVVVGPFRQSVIPPGFDAIWQRFAAVVIGMRPVRPALSCAANDQFSTSKQAMSALRDLGYRRPGLCINPEVDAHVEERFRAGFSMAQKDMPKNDRLPVFDFQPTARERFKRWVKSHRPDSIVTLHHEIKGWVEEMGLDVPGDVGLVHLDRVPDLEGWAGTRQNNESVGYAAIDLVVGQLHRNEMGIPPFQKCTFTNSTWIPGATVRKLDGLSKRTCRADRRLVVHDLKTT